MDRRPISLSMKLLVIGGAAFVTLVVLFTAGEITVRYREKHRATVPGTMPLLFYRHERLGHALLRNADYFGWVSTDSNGFRVTPGTTAGTTPLVRIVADGGSTTFDGNTGADRRTWPARLQYWLTQLTPDSRVEVTNAGVPGYRVVENLIRLQTELYRCKPNVIILLQGHNDLFRALRGEAVEPERDPSRPGEIRNHSFLRSWLSAHSLFYAKVQERLNILAFRSRGRRSLAGAESDAVFDRRLTEGAEQFERDLRSFVAVAGTLGITVVLPAVVHVTGPDDSTVAGNEADVWRNAVPFAPPEMVLRGYRRYNDVIRRVAEETGAFYIDTRAFDLHGRRFYDDGDPIHFSPEGADAMGRHLAQSLIDAGVIHSAEPGSSNGQDD
jgi:lysophospholipase L1-like esterase